MAPPLLGCGQPVPAAAPPGAPQVGAAAAAVAPHLLGRGQPKPAAAPPGDSSSSGRGRHRRMSVAARIAVSALIAQATVRRSRSQPAAAAMASPLLGCGQPVPAAAPPGAPQVGAAAAAIAPRLLGRGQPQPAADPPGDSPSGGRGRHRRMSVAARIAVSALIVQAPVRRSRSQPASAAMAPPLLGCGQPVPTAAPPGAPQVGAAAAATAPPLLGRGHPVPAAAPPRAPQVGAAAASGAPRLVGRSRPRPAAAPRGAPQVGAAAAALAPRLFGRGQPQLAAAPPGVPQVGAAAAAIAPCLVGRSRPRPSAAPPGAPQVGAAAAAIAPRLLGRGQPQQAAAAAPLVGQRGPRLACHMMVQYDMFNFLTNQVGTAAIIRSVETENGFLTTVNVPG
jgi:hypothetical protein